MTTLGKLGVKETAKIVGFDKSDKVYRRKLLSMGLTKGAQLSVLRVAPLGDPMEIDIKGYHLCLRKNEANMVLVERSGKAG